MMAARRLAAAARVRQRMPFQTTSYVSSIAAARSFSTVQPERATSGVAPSAKEKDAIAINQAYARIVKKFASIPRKDIIDLDNVEEKIEDTVTYLQDRLQMTRLGAIRTVALHPTIIGYTPEAMDRKLEVLEDIGVRGAMLTNAIRRCPNIMGTSEAAIERVKDWYLELGIDPEKIPYMFMVYPQATSYSWENKERKVQTLRDFGLNDERICRILQRFPQILTGNADHFREKVAVLQADLGLTDDDIVKILPLVPEVLLSTVDRVKKKIAALDNLFGAGAGARLWILRPRLIMYNLHSVRRSANYLTEVVGYPIERVAANITVVMRSAETVIRPRYEFLCESGNMDALDSSRWILMSDASFRETYPGYGAFLETKFKAKQ